MYYPAHVEQEQDVPLSPEQLASRLRQFEGYREKITEDIKCLDARRLRLQEDMDEYTKLVENVDRLLAVRECSLALCGTCSLF